MLSDVFAVLVLAGVATALVIRTVVRPARFAGSHVGEGYFILGLIALVVLTLLAWHHLGGIVLRVGASRRHRRVPRVPAVLEAPAHRDGGGERVVRAHARRAGGSSRCASTCPTTSCASASATIVDLTRKEVRRRVLVHRVRPLPGRVPGARDGEDPVAEAPDHGRPRPGVRAERGADRRQRRAGGDDLGLRDVRRVRRGVPGVDRARRPHRRPAPEPA